MESLRSSIFSLRQPISPLQAGEQSRDITQGSAAGAWTKWRVFMHMQFGGQLQLGKN